MVQLELLEYYGLFLLFANYADATTLFTIKKFKDKPQYNNY